MARPRTVITPASPPVPATVDGEPNPLGEPQSSLEIEANIKRAIVELGEHVASSKVQVWRWIKGERQPKYVTTYAPDAFSLERVAEDCGGGVYEIKVYAPQIEDDGTAKGLLKLVARPRIELDGPAKVIRRPEPEPASPQVPAQVDGLALLVKTLADRFEKMDERLARMNDRPSMVETLKELVAIKSLFSSDAPRGPDPLEQFGKFLEMQDKMKSALDRLPSDASDNTLLLALGKDFLSMFKKATDAPAQLPNPGPDADPPLGASAPGPENPPQPITSVPEEDPMNLIFKGYVNLLVSNAKANNDIEPIAQTIYDQAPDDLLAKLFATESWLDELAKLNPAVKLYPQWFEKLRARIREIHDADSAGT